MFSDYLLYPLAVIFPVTGLDISKKVPWDPIRRDKAERE
jgi:hypothetical protein